MASGKYAKDTINAVSERHHETYLKNLSILLGQEIDEKVIKAQKLQTARDTYMQKTGFDITSPEFAKLDEQLAQALLDE